MFATSSEVESTVLCLLLHKPMKRILMSIADSFGVGVFISLRTKEPRVSSLAQFLADFQSPDEDSGNKLSLDLGCGSSPRRIFDVGCSMGIDILPGSHPEVIVADLIRQSIPMASNSAEYVYAFDFLEHVPRYVAANHGGVSGTKPFISLMNEIHRILKPRGLFLSSTPAYPYPQAFQDPTHTNIVTEKTFPLYFCTHPSGSPPWAYQYGFTGSFQCIKQAWLHWNLLSLLRKP